MGRWLAIVIALIGVLGSALLCKADEFAGRLERVDLESVTIRDSSDKLVVLRVNRDRRFQAAPFLGRWVTVDFRNEQGEFRAIGFRADR